MVPIYRTSTVYTRLMQSNAVCTCLIIFWLLTPCNTAGDFGLCASLAGELVWGLVTVTAEARPGTVRLAWPREACTWMGLPADWPLSGRVTTACSKTDKQESNTGARQDRIGHVICLFYTECTNAIVIWDAVVHLRDVLSMGHSDRHPDVVRALMH